ncbi:MAG: serine/threonine protein kinase, partial [Candidatus Eisenbacteria bacterium]|nr:serine/threonine protein kinase [Candidatus Eisenbacteria bacterium]
MAQPPALRGLVVSERERYQRLKRIFEEACDLPAPDRAAYLAAACGEDVGLRDEVAAMLAAEDDPDAALQESERGVGPEILAEEMSSSVLVTGSVPTRIGRYEIVREIGRGGMGAVYEAEQAHPRRRVAVKVIQSAYVSSELVKRFRHEAQLLGQLDHPGIARVYEAGTAEVGRDQLPYLAMELVEGLRLDEHARANGLSCRQILELVALVCDAVQHAHLRGIIHRDLKPPNVLVKHNTEVSGGSAPGTEASAQPKVLDFGVARATDADLAVTTVHTRAGQVVGTLSYMSPEQVAGRTDVDARCDVYALGVILYELLAQERPFDFTNIPMVEAARIIAQDDPTSLGARVPALDPDVVTIVAKAMEKDRERRYRSAAELADDLRRYLRSEPIAARPASATYLLRRYARRHRTAVAGMVATLTVLVLGLIASTVGFVTALKERDAKTSALETSDAVTEF